MGYAQAATRTYQYIPDNVIQLSNAGFSRKIVYGNSWQKIRFGMLCAVQNNTIPAGNLANVLCHFGLSSSIGPGICSYVTQNFIGVSLNSAPTAGAALTYTADTWPFPYYLSGSTPVVFAKMGTDYYTTTAGTAMKFAPYISGTQRRFPYIVDIQRSSGGGGTFTINVYSVSAAGDMQLDYSPHHLFNGLDSTGTPVCNGITLTAMCSAKTISWGESSGPLDTLNIFWSKSTAPLEISAVGAVLQDITNYVTSTSSGTSFGGMLETWGGGTVVRADTYGYGTLLSGTLTPYYASGALVSAGSHPNLVPYTWLSGTTTGPYDNFESYVAGTVQSGVTVNAGIGWGGAATVYGW